MTGCGQGVVRVWLEQEVRKLLRWLESIIFQLVNFLLLKTILMRNMLLFDLRNESKIQEIIE